MSGNGRKIVTPRPTLLPRTMGLRPKWETTVFALIEAARGTTPLGCFAQRPAREIRPTTETRSWGFVWQRHCRNRNFENSIVVKTQLYLLTLIIVAGASAENGTSA